MPTLKNVATYELRIGPGYPGGAEAWLAPGISLVFLPQEEKTVFESDFERSKGLQEFYASGQLTITNPDAEPSDVLPAPNPGTAKSLLTATTVVVVGSAAAPTAGQVLTATGPTAADWETPGGGGIPNVYNDALSPGTTFVDSLNPGGNIRIKPVDLLLASMDGTAGNTTISAGRITGVPPHTGFVTQTGGNLLLFGGDSQAHLSALVCFAAGTKITMADGGLKNIEDVKVGDVVKSYDNVKKVLVSSVVTLLHHHTSPEELSEYLILKTKRGALRVTANHLIYTEGSWKEAAGLKQGDLLLTDLGEVEVVESSSPVHEKIDTYNFEVKDSRSYFADGVLVHNDKGSVHRFGGDVNIRGGLGGTGSSKDGNVNLGGNGGNGAVRLVTTPTPGYVVTCTDANGAMAWASLASRIIAIQSSPSIGGQPPNGNLYAESLMFSGFLVATDVVLSVTQVVPGPNNTATTGFATNQHPGSPEDVDVVWTADPGAGAVLVMIVLR